MAKVALIVGVSEYQAGLAPLPGAVKDAAAMKQVLEQQGNFDEIQVLENPDPLELQEAVEVIFSGRKKEDLALVFFSGHGIKDDRGRLYFATRLTRKNARGELVKATAVPASFLHDIMDNSRCKRQVIILDCCFSGAFAEGMQTKSDDTVDLQTQLGGEGRAVLTSSSSTQYSFEQDQETLSVYTRFIIEGIQTGAADTDNDGFISIDELHEYASAKVQEAAPAMRPKIYIVEEGFKIHVAQAPINDPKLRYRKEIEQFASRGEISAIGRSTLNVLQKQLGISADEAATIEAEVLHPYQEYQQRLQQYETAFTQAVQKQQPITQITRSELDRFKQVLGLENVDVAPIEAKFAPSPEPTPAPQPEPAPVVQQISPLLSPEEKPQSKSINFLWLMGSIAGVGVIVGAIALFTNVSSNPTINNPDIPTIEIPDTQDRDAQIPDTESPIGNPQLISNSSTLYNHPHNLYQVVIPKSYTVEEIKSDTIDKVVFKSLDGHFTGTINVTTIQSPIPTDEFSEYVLKDVPDFKHVRYRDGSACTPPPEGFVCKAWYGNDNRGKPVKGERIARQLGNKVYIMDLHSVDETLLKYSSVARQMVRTFTPFEHKASVNRAIHLAPITPGN
ncbi:caspase, EACC1-associated type [Adonisia turfae]|uniref:EF-hand domain-containing protein n=1 Tax=Adonisia turfae CCMR0081 TaxID=2292702 RepID=A0A6M0RH30_9CYAN|nr:caspase family protein [Adonisia turfae]NEZ55495.1 hypothetical protein [Adonisia turfae CCMR0081]